MTELHLCMCIYFLLAHLCVHVYVWMCLSMEVEIMLCMSVIICYSSQRNHIITIEVKGSLLMSDNETESLTDKGSLKLNFFIVAFSQLLFHLKFEFVNVHAL